MSQTLLVHYAHADCAIAPGTQWDDENGPEYGACNSECPACETSDIEPVSWHPLLEQCGDDCARAMDAVLA